MQYKSFEVAYKAFNFSIINPNNTIDGNNYGIASLKLIFKENSYNEILQDGRIIKYVGQGLQLRPGHPAANQQWQNQEPFRISMKNTIVFPVLFKSKAGFITLMGKYKIIDIIKKMSFEGFTYFHIILQRVSKRPEIGFEGLVQYKYPRIALLARVF